MSTSVVLECIISFVVIVCCYGKPVEDFHEHQDVRFNEAELGGYQIAIQNLYSLLNESMLKETLMGFSKRKENDVTFDSSNALPAYSLKANLTLEDRFKENTEETSKSPLEDKPQRPTFAGELSSGQLGQLIPPGKPWPADPPIANPFLEDRFKGTSPAPPQAVSTEKTSKSPLEYKPQRPTFAGELSGGQLGQLIPPGRPWPADPPEANTVLEDRFKETTATPSQAIPTDETSKSPLEYKPQRPTFAGELSSGQLGQLIPPGKPWPADPPIANPVLEDRFKETTATPSQALPTDETSKSPLEYKPQRPTFAGELSSGQLGQLIPPGKPWPADPPITNPVLEDRFKETTAAPPQALPTDQTSKSPLEYKPQRPTFATQLSSGQLGQLIPPGKPWPADPPIANPVLEDRSKETTAAPPQALPTDQTGKSPLEYKPQRPTFATQLSSGQLGQLIPPGKPWPADPPIANPVLEDRFKETTAAPPQALPTDQTSKSPLEYKPQRPTFATQLSSGQLGQLIPPGKPWPADPPIANPVLEDRSKETTAAPPQALPTDQTSKSPLEYKPQRPTFATQLSSGQLGQLIPPGKPWPADPPIANPVLEDRFKETTAAPPQALPTDQTSKSPLEYKPQRPTFATQLSSGQLGQLIPPGKPWPADPPIANPVLEDRFKETTAAPPHALPTDKTSKSPLEYKPQRPTFATQLSSGQLGQLIPPGKPWPADPPIANPVLEDRFKETTAAPPQPLPTDQTSKSPLEYKPQRPTFATQLSSGQLGQLIPPGKPWPADPPIANPVLEDRFKETTAAPPQALPTDQTSKSPLEYKPQRPTFAGELSGGQLGQLIPPGRPWPADPPEANTVLEDRFKETTATPSQALPIDETSKSPLEYKPQRPTFAGELSSGQLGQLIPPGQPWPADPPIANPVLEDRFKETTAAPPQALQTDQTSKSPLEYKPQRPTFAGELSGGQLGQLIPPGRPWPADPPEANTVLEDRFKETTATPSQALPIDETSKSPLEYKPQRPTFAGELSSGQLGQLIPPGKPWPADPPIANTVLEDRFKETTAAPPQTLPTDQTSKSPLEYKPQRPTFAGQLSSGQLGQLIPPGQPWPADPPITNPVLEDRFKETTAAPPQASPTDESSKSPLEYKPQRPTFAGQLSSGQLGQLIPPGKPWPADPIIINY